MSNARRPGVRSGVVSNSSRFGSSDGFVIDACCPAPRSRAGRAAASQTAPPYARTKSPRPRL
ncbi:hypothetical protein DCN14_26350 [Burkholderia sp. IDO3]|nr:hypothetical protein DCN14_26350 [Burkholderia sp. IDO3]